MRRGREQLEAEELRRLAGPAQASGASAGRLYPEPRHPYRTEFQRDRARLIHSRAFRRLEYKTQVFLNGSGDHLRTRLTHTIEVASVSRTIARALGLNEDLAEAIALAHDLGHPPFGHPGEATLNRLMDGHGGFDHNRQCLRIVQVIESSYPRFPGLNLTFEVIEGLRKHDTLYHPPPGGSTAEPYSCPTLEAQIADVADEIAYRSHDLDDGLDAGLIDPGALESLTLWRETRMQMDKGISATQREGRAGVIRALIERQVEDVIAASAARIEAAGVKTVDEVRRRPAPLIAYSDELAAAAGQMRQFLFNNLYRHPAVAASNDNACAMLEVVFRAYLAKPELLGLATAARVQHDGLQRTVCDYLSGMTDRYLAAEHRKLVEDNAFSCTQSTIRAG